MRKSLAEGPRKKADAEKPCGSPACKDRAEKPCGTRPRGRARPRNERCGQTREKIPGGAVSRKQFFHKD